MVFVSNGPTTESIAPQYGFTTDYDLYDKYQLKPGHYQAAYVRDGDDIAFGYVPENDPLKLALKGKTLASARVSFEVK